MLGALLVVMSVSNVSACESDAAQNETARHTLEVFGFSSIQISRANMFRCGQGDAFAREFHAVGPSGKSASGVVCWGITSNPTIRPD